MRSAFATKCLSLTVLVMAWLNTAAVITANASCVSPPEIVFQTEYCCTLKAEHFNFSKSNSDKEMPCKCRSQANARIKDAVVTNSFRWHLSTMSLFRHQYPLRAQTPPTRASAVHSFANKPQLYILNACLLI